VRFQKKRGTARCEGCRGLAQAASIAQTTHELKQRERGLTAPWRAVHQNNAGNDKGKKPPRTIAQKWDTGKENSSATKEPPERNMAHTKHGGALNNKNPGVFSGLREQNTASGTLKWIQRPKKKKGDLGESK